MGLACLPCAAGTSLLDSPCFQAGGREAPGLGRLCWVGGGKSCCCCARPVWGRCPPSQLSVGSPGGCLQAFWLCPAESSRERLVHAVLSLPEGPFWSLYKILLRLGILPVLQGSSLVCRLLLLCLNPAGGGMDFTGVGKLSPTAAEVLSLPFLLSPLFWAPAVLLTRLLRGSFSPLRMRCCSAVQGVRSVTVYFCSGISSWFFS